MRNKLLRICPRNVKLNSKIKLINPLSAIGYDNLGVSSWINEIAKLCIPFCRKVQALNANVKILP